ncbi:MAG: sensor histidine kinase [Candidatus Thorarchaeota archaeon]
MACPGDTVVMIWDPFEIFLWGIAIAIALICGIYFLRIGKKREIFNEQIIMLGLGSLPLGFALALLFTLFQSFQISGYFNYDSLTFCGVYNGESFLYEIFGRLSYISLGIGGLVFILAFEIIVKRTKYLLSISFLLIIVIEFVFPFNITRNLFNYLLLPGLIFSVPLILYFYTKWSHLEFKAVSSFLLFGFILFMISLNLAKRAHKLLDVFPLFLSPLVLIIGCCFTIVPIIINPKALSGALKYWIFFAILTIPLLFSILIIDIFNELNFIFILEFIGATLYVYILFFLVIREIRTERISVTQGMHIDDDIETDFLEMFTRPQKVTFLASISHELKTPLTSIIGFTGMLLNGKIGALNEEQENQLNIILNNSNRLLGLINDILDITKIDAKKLTIRKDKFDLVEELKRLKETFSVALNGKGLKLLIDSPEPFIIYNDKQRINQILTNLIGNAIKFTEKGKISVVVKQKNGISEILVKDTGLGIKEEDVHKLFKPFSQIIEPGRTKEGSGLGLHLSKKLANLLGGDLSVNSKFGKGSIFKLVLKSINEDIS